VRRIALYSDVHANLPALEAVFADMDAEGVTDRYCLGDLVGYGPHPGETIARVAACGDAIVQGNYDRAIGSHLSDCGSAFATPQETLDGAESFAFTISRMSAGEANYLCARDQELRVNAEGVELYLCHGSPRQVSDIILPDASPSLLVELARDARTYVVCAGHIHVAFHRSVPTQAGVYHWVNAGAVGRPRDGDPRACWVEVVIGSQPDVLERAADDLACRRVGASRTWLGVRIHRVAYDVERVVHDMAAKGLPATLAAGLRTGAGEGALAVPSAGIHRMDSLGAGGEGATGWTRPVRRGGQAEEVAEPVCTCPIADRIAAYESMAAIFSESGSAVRCAAAGSTRS
jgi:predicted phosphodiesterase